MTAYLYVPFIAWVVAQGIKMLIEIFKGEADLRYLYASGGMPSAHSAVVTALAGYTFYHQGIDSPLFGVTAVFAAIVMYDSFGVRRSAGEQARTLNKLISEMSHNGDLRKPDDYIQLGEILGHQPLEVIVGALLGGLVATLFSLDQLSPIIEWLTQSPNTWQINVIYAIGAILIVVPVLLRFLLKKKLKANKKLSYIFKFILFGSIFAGILVLFSGFIAKEGIANYGQRWLSLSILSLWFIYMLVVVWRWFNLKKVPRFSDQVINPRKDDWLKKAGKKK